MQSFVEKHLTFISDTYNRITAEKSTFYKDIFIIRILKEILSRNYEV